MRECPMCKGPGLLDEKACPRCTLPGQLRGSGFIYQDDLGLRAIPDPCN